VRYVHASKLQSSESVSFKCEMKRPGKAGVLPKLNQTASTYSSDCTSRSTACFLVLRISPLSQTSLSHLTTARDLRVADCNHRAFPRSSKMRGVGGTLSRAGRLHWSCELMRLCKVEAEDETRCDNLCFLQLGSSRMSLPASISRWLDRNSIFSGSVSVGQLRCESSSELTVSRVLDRRPQSNMDCEQMMETMETLRLPLRLPRFSIV
jgi:hypothetical protein